MAAAYGTIGNSGKYNAPTAIIKIVDRNGKVIFEHKQETKTVVDAKAAYQTVDIMRDVFVDGTAGGAGIGRPAAGKTGTTDDYKDAWFVGFTICRLPYGSAMITAVRLIICMAAAHRSASGMNSWLTLLQTFPLLTLSARQA